RALAAVARSSQDARRPSVGGREQLAIGRLRRRARLARGSYRGLCAAMATGGGGERRGRGFISATRNRRFARGLTSAARRRRKKFHRFTHFKAPRRLADRPRASGDRSCFGYACICRI